MSELACPRCGSTDGDLYRPGQPEHILLNPWLCTPCTRGLIGLPETKGGPRRWWQWWRNG